MLRTLVVGVALEVIGTMLYDAELLDPYLVAAKEKLDEGIPARISKALDIAKSK